MKAVFLKIVFYSPTLPNHNMRSLNKYPYIHVPKSSVTACAVNTVNIWTPYYKSRDIGKDIFGVDANSKDPDQPEICSLVRNVAVLGYVLHYLMIL